MTPTPALFATVLLVKRRAPMAALIRSVRYGGSVLTRFYLPAIVVNDTQQSVARASTLDQYLYVANHIP